MIPDFAFEYCHGGFRASSRSWALDARVRREETHPARGARGRRAGRRRRRIARRRRGDRRAGLPGDSLLGNGQGKDVADVLREYERQLVAESAADLPDEIRPDADVVTLETVADEHGVSEDALEAVAFPEHERVGRTLLRPATLEAVGEEIDAGVALSDAEAVLESYGASDSSAILSELGYRVEWEGLAGGTVVER